MNIELLLRILIMFFGIIDMILTWKYLDKYSKLNPHKNFKEMEKNKLIILLVNRYGLRIGMAISMLIILTLISVIVTDANIIFVLILLIYQLYALKNHKKNFKILDKLGKIEKKNE